MTSKSKILTAGWSFFLCGLLAVSGHAQAGAEWATQGRTRLALTAGYASFNDHNYGVLGGGVGYYLMDGLEAGLDGEAWLGSKPHIYTLSPGARYTFTQWEAIKPYFGGFFKRTFYETLPDLSSAGGRVGVVSPLGAHTLLTAGLVYERYFECDTTIYDSCSMVYPEVGISFSF